jgi:hypothetical protein
MNLSNENRLLLYCSQANISENRVAQLNDLLSRSLDWEFISEAAFSRNIAQLLYHNLKDLGNRHLIPPEVLEKLKKGYHGNIARNMFLYAELRNIVNAFQSAGLKVIALKGAALAGIVYRDAGLRPMMDLDLLVRKDDLGIAQRIMTDLHYTAAAELKSEQWHRENHHHLPLYRHPQKPVVVEIHWHFTENSFGIDIKKWWERAREAKLRGCRVLVLSPEDMLVHLCIHLYNHGYENTFFLRGLCDIAETLRHYEAELDWKLLGDEIMKHGIERQVHSMLYLAREFYDLKERYLHLINLNQVDHRFLQILEKSLFADQGNTSINPHLLKSMVFNTFLQKERYLLPQIFPSREEMAKRYPVSPSSKMIFFYYLLHPFHLMAKYGKSVVEIFRTRAGKNGRE